MRVHSLRRTAALVGVTLAVTLLGGAPAARAADNGHWSIFPTTVPGQLARPYFQPLLVPGVPLQDSVTVTNKTDTPLTFNIYAADAFNTTVGGFSLRRRTDPKVDIAKWVQFPVDSITVGPHALQQIPFSISPPADATSGDHPGGLVVEATQGPVSRSGALSVETLQAVGTRIYARVRGPVLPSLAVTETHLAVHQGVLGLLGGKVDADVTYTIANTGNVRLTPKAIVEANPFLGSGTTLKPKDVPELLPHGQATIRQRISGIWPLGRLTAHVTASAASVKAEGQTSQWVIPWLLILVLVVILGIWIYRRRRRPDTLVQPTTGSSPRPREPVGA